MSTHGRRHRHRWKLRDEVTCGFCWTALDPPPARPLRRQRSRPTPARILDMSELETETRAQRLARARTAQATMCDLRVEANSARREAASKARERRQRRWRPVKRVFVAVGSVLAIWLALEWERAREPHRTPQEVKQYEQYENLGAE
jgi:hypothetical protein